MDGPGSSNSATTNGAGSRTGYTGAIAAISAPTPATIATATIAPPKRLETGTSWSRPETPTKTSRKAPSSSRTGTAPTKNLKHAAPTAVSKPAKSNQRETTSLTPGPLPTENAAAGGARPEPTPNATTPATVCPSSETTRQSTV